MKRPAADAGRPVSSLGRRLSAWLALQGLLATLLVSFTVYAVNFWMLHSRQSEELELKSLVVRHAMAENETSDQVEELRHKLADFLAGHDDMMLSLTTGSGQVLFESSSKPRSRLKTLVWQIRWPSDATEEARVVLGLDVSRDDELLRRLGWALVAASLLGASIVSATGFMLVRRGLRPLRELSAQVDAVALGQSGMRLDGADQAEELLPLVERFNALLSRVERAYHQLEGFNADVAHELRTPLTTLIGSSELALQRDRPAAELRDVIAGNLEDLRRLATIINDMLFLTQADRGAAARCTTVVSLHAALVEIIDFHDAALQERDLSARCFGDAAGRFDISLLRRALSNLLSNATRHADEGSLIRVRIESRTGWVRLLVENDGAIIDPESLPRLFDRFFRAERSRRHSGSANFGLGLAIVAAIARMHGGGPIGVSKNGVTAIGIDIPRQPLQR